MNIGWLDIFRRNSELEWMYDLELIEETSNRIAMKKLAVQTCVNMIARIWSQSEFRIRDGDQFIKDSMYYALNVRPNRNTSAPRFWRQVIHKLVFENECLIIQNDTKELLVADSFERVQSANYEDRFRDVIVKDYTFQRTFSSEEVIYLEYANEDLVKFTDSIYEDYGELIGRLFEFQKRKGQIRATVDLEQISAKDKETQEKLQNFINRIYDSVGKNSISVVPQQKGFSYKENQTNSASGNVEEINAVMDGFLNQVARALGIPPALARGEVADVDTHTRNMMTFCIDPLIEQVTDEMNATFFTKQEFLKGKHIDIRRVSHRDLFDVATAADKLRSSGVLNGHEIRDALGYERSDDPIHDKYFITKNYSDTLEGGEKDE